MPTPATGTALLILIGFVLPGFVAVLLKERLYEVRGEETAFDRLLTTVYYSLLVYLLPALCVILLDVVGVLDRDELSRFLRGEAAIWLTALVALAVLLVIPALAALAAWRWMGSGLRRRLFDSSERLNAEHRTQTSWDFAFNHEQDLLLVIELNDGDRIAGYYGTRSHSGYGTRTRDLFLEERWDISDDDGSISPPPTERRSVGIWIEASNIRLIDHYAMSDEHKRDIEERSPDRT
ncbi:DUF6338 family protein [Candidatus Solirubrobacter pratensis]|uniref:DUF6338 family protein n=1 Tax=Candidatus Solirubrobacter pratensis TaxID=1298857 RepID=UPI000483CED8|nr:DUF6338 family protein [Candidatus Solirubrobacter pratensis]